MKRDCRCIRRRPVHCDLCGWGQPSGTLRAYQVSDGTKLRMNLYDGCNCKPYEFGSSVIPPMQPWVRMTAMPSHRRLTFREDT